jgi:large subunit ribosomal protein L9
MNIILLEPVDKLGDAGAVVRVKDGFARNWLIPQGLALPATRANQAELDARLAQRAKQLSERKVDAERLAEMLGEASISIVVKAGEGRIYGSVGNRDIAEALKAAYDIEIDRRKIVLNEPIKVLGEFTIPYRPHPEVTIDLKLTVSADEDEG